MSDPKGRALPNLLSMYFIMLLIYCLDVFFIESDLTVLGDNFYSRFISFVVLLLLLIFKKEHIKNFGITKKKEKIKDALICGMLFSIVPLLIVSIFELFMFKISDPTKIDISFNPPSLNYVRTEGYLTPGVCISIYILTTFFAACFKEMFFRGFLLHKLEKLTVFKSANIFQALLYMTFIIPKLIRNFAKGYYGEEIVQLAVFVVIFYLVHEFITGIKWGLLAKSGGTTYISIVDNFLYVFLANSVRVVDQSTKWLFMLHMLSAQIISLAMVFIYYKRHLVQSTESKSKEKTTLKVPKLKKYASPENNEVNEDMHTEQAIANTTATENTISPNQFKNIVKVSSIELNESDKAHNGELSEDEIDSFLKSFGKPQHHYHPPVKKKEPQKPVDETIFDVDDYLKGYSKNK